MIAVTGFGQPQDKELAAASGFDRHLVKPVDLRVLTEILAEVPKEPIVE
jgi:two-component system CheB/CheR fusion protein